MADLANRNVTKRRPFLHNRYGNPSDRVAVKGGVTETPTK